MTVYTVKNLVWLKQYYPKIYESVRNRVADEQLVRMTEARNGQANVEIRYGDAWFPLYSQYDPKREVERWVDKMTLTDDSTLLLFGFGFGYHMRAVLERYPNVQVHVYEPSLNVFLLALEHVDLTQLPRERIVSFEVETDEDGDVSPFAKRHAFFAKVVDNTLDSTPIVEQIPAYARLFKDEQVAFFQQFKESVISTRFNINTTRNHEKRWTLNALLNFPFTVKSPSVDVLKPLMSGKPLVIVSSGPSLEQEVDHLKSVRDHVVILAAGSSVNGLLHHGIEPHAVLSFDPAEGNKKVFDLMESYDVDIPFIFGTTLYHEILSTYEYSTLYHMIISQDRVTPYVFRRTNHRETIFSDAPSVAILALQLAYHIEANPIIFVGQDLAFPGKKFYASGVAHKRGQYLTDEEIKQYVEVEQVGGGKVLTSRSINEMRKSMEVFLQEYKRMTPNLTVINTSQEGAKISHTVELPFKDVIERYIDMSQTIENPFKLSIEQIEQQMIDREKAYEVYNRLLSTHTQLREKVNDLKQTVLQLKQSANAQKREKLFRDIGRKVNKLTKDRLFSTVFIPMLRTQLDAYVRTAKQTMKEPFSDENLQKMIARDQALIEEFEYCYELLKRKGVFHE